MKRSSLKPAQLLALVAFVTLPLLEVSAYVAGKVLSRQAVVYVPAPIDAYDQWLLVREPVLGWPSPSAFGRGEIDSRGGRVIPAFPDPDSASCVSVFGDSFTFGDEVSPEESYPNVLARRLGCRVNNFGVGGYGTDQAFLRYRQIADNSPAVVLGHFSEDIIRNVNQFRDFIGGSGFGLKPRFILDEQGRLQLIPMPKPTRDEAMAIVRGQPAALAFEYFRPGGPAGIVSLRFPYSWSILQMVHHYRVRARLARTPSYAQFYAEDHPSRAFAITVAIMSAFVAEARQRGQAPLVLLIPDLKDLTMLTTGGRVAYESLIRALASNGLPFLDAAPFLASHLGGRDACALYTNCAAGHFTAEGYALLADAASSWLQSNTQVHPRAVAGLERRLANREAVADAARAQPDVDEQTNSPACSTGDERVWDTTRFAAWLWPRDGSSC